MAIQKKEPEIAASLDNLAGIMQYLTYESNSKYVSLEKEIELLRNYIDIHHLRIGETDDTTISFNLEGNPIDKTIAPVILLPLVENAFKHGVKPDKKCLVSIKIIILKNKLKLHISNTYFKKSNLEVKNKGIGLENVRKRLDLVYSGIYDLKLTQNETHFYTELELELDHSENKKQHAESVYS